MKSFVCRVLYILYFRDHYIARVLFSTGIGIFRDGCRMLSLACSDYVPKVVEDVTCRTMLLVFIFGMCNFGPFVFFPQVEGRYLDMERMLSEDCWWNLQEQLGLCVFNVLIFNWQQIEPFGYRQILLPPPSLP